MASSKEVKIKVNKMIYIDLDIRKEIELYCSNAGYGFSEFIEKMWRKFKEEQKNNCGRK